METSKMSSLNIIKSCVKKGKGSSYMTLLVHLDLRISPQIFEKIQNDPNIIFRGLGEGDK
jgi:hypothetical protein